MWRVGSIGLLALAACQPAEEAPVDPGAPLDPLVMPDYADVDLPAAYADALALALDVRMEEAWAGHVATLGMITAGCPDLWAGAPDTLDVDDGTGVSWADHCDNGAGVDFSGGIYWESAASVTGDAESADGAVTAGERRLVGDGVVGAGAEARFEFDGEASDAVTLSDAPGYQHWSWSSLVQATVSGSEVFQAEGDTPGGYRADVYLYVTGGDADTLEARGNLYMFEDRLAGRFDSVAMDLTFAGETGAGPTDCTAEPQGWLSLRDTDAYWYDLVFLPTDSADTGTVASCDGCGTLYVRGVEAGEVCPDLSGVWDGRLAAPPIADFVLSLHDLL